MNASEWRRYNEQHLKELYKPAVSIIQSFKMYEKYKPQIDFILFDLIANGATWNVDGDRDIKKLWGVISPNSEKRRRAQDAIILNELFDSEMFIAEPSIIRSIPINYRY
jgi:hypothetical protein